MDGGHHPPRTGSSNDDMDGQDGSTRTWSTLWIAVALVTRMTVIYFFIHFVLIRILLLTLNFMHDRSGPTPLAHENVVVKLLLRHAFLFLLAHYYANVASIAIIHRLLDTNLTLTCPPTLEYDKRTAFS